MVEQLGHRQLYDFRMGVLRKSSFQKAGAHCILRVEIGAMNSSGATPTRKRCLA